MNEGGNNQEENLAELAGFDSNKKLNMDTSDVQLASTADKKENKLADASNEKSSMKKSGKASAYIEQPKNHPLSYFYGGISAFALGWSLYFSADLGTRLDGIYGPASFWPGCLLTWLLFHFKDWLMWKLGKTEDLHPGEGWFSQKRSMYFELYFEDEEEVQAEGGSANVHKVSPENSHDQEGGAAAVIDELKDQKTYLGWSCQRFQGSCSRGIIELLINVALIYSFMFAEKSGINPGIISSIFSSTCVFTIVIFYFAYGQKLSINDFVGTLFIMLCVVFISLGGGGKGSDSEEEPAESTLRMLVGAGPSKGPKEPITKEQADMYLYFSVIAALAAGFILSINTVSLQYCVDKGCRIDQANFDGNFLMFSIFFPFYVVTEITAPGTYIMKDLISGSMDIICITIGVIALGKGLACGNGGPMQAIENQKTVIVTIITAIVYEKMPTTLQICGLVSGIVGVLFIVFQKQKKAKDGEEQEEKEPEEKAEGEIVQEKSAKNATESGNINVGDDSVVNQVR